MSLIESIGFPIMTLGGLGILFGTGLAVASQKFAVEMDPKEEAILKVVPGANCGACGYPGCGGFATAVAKGEAPASGCPVGGAAVAEAIAEIMGVEAGGADRKVARVICGGRDCNANSKSEYEGIMDCKAANLISGGEKTCMHGCLGLGTCVAVCDFDAITIEDGIAVIDEEKCTSCGKCIKECPKRVIDLVPVKQQVFVDCNSHDKGKTVREGCSVGCIGCTLCVKACPFDAIVFEDNLAKIDYDKCKNCMLCAEKCPTKAIYAELDKRKKAYIKDEKCIGCTICARNCPVDAIEGEVKKLHTIDKEKCIGCGVCEEKCPKDAIEMK